MYGGLATAAPISQTCLGCGTPFPAFSDRDKFCCGRHRTAYWKEQRKRAALVQALGERYRLSKLGMAQLARAIEKAPERFYGYAAWCGLCYKTKQYRWERQKRNAA